MTNIQNTAYSGFSYLQLANGIKTSNANVDFFADSGKSNPANNAGKTEKTSSVTTQNTTTTNISAAQLQKAEHAKTMFAVQQIAQNDAKQEPTAAEKSYNDAVSAFTEYTEGTPEERFFKAFLKKEGLTEDQFNNLPAEDKEKLLEKFKDFVKQKNEEAIQKEQTEKQIKAAQ